jgi:hypothetical protein
MSYDQKAIGDSAISLLVGFGESDTSNWLLNAAMIQFFADGTILHLASYLDRLTRQMTLPKKCSLQVNSWIQ